MGELWAQDANELARMIASREVSSREVVEAHLARIDAVNPHLNAVVLVLADDALAAADRADAAVAAGGPLGALHGVPFTVKENIDVAGTATTQAVKALAQAVATIDAPQVTRMRAAGAIPIGRTNLPDFGLRVHTDSELYGLTKNPWHPGRTAGGSSGGEAAALASGMSPIGLGNDLGGSLRNPAHCCGVSSIKPTTGVVARATCIPPEDMMVSFQMLAVEGVMARRPHDVRTGLLALAGQDVRDPISVPAVLTDLQPGERLRVAILPEPPGGSTHPGIAAATRAAGDALADAGHDVVETAPPNYERVLELWQRILSVDLRVMLPLLNMVMGPDGRRFMELGIDAFPELDLATWATEMAERDTHRRQWAAWFVEHPAFVSPVWSQPAFPHGADIVDAAGALGTLELMRPVLPANYLGLPAAVAPVGMADGLPVGVQVMGPAFSDLRCIAVAEQLESALGLATPIDPVTA
jgi:amidase